MSDAARLRLFQLVSPALPVGAFSYSEGLEVLVQRQVITSSDALHNWLLAELQRGSVSVETAALAPLHRCWSCWCNGDLQAGQQLLDLDGWLLAQREAAELRSQQRQMGGSLLQLMADLGWPQPHGEASSASVAWPAAFAWAGLCLEIEPQALAEAYLYGWVASQVSAAVRLLPLGPTQGQQLQLQLSAVIAARAQDLTTVDPRRIWSGGVGASLAQLSHAELYSRLFRS